MEEMRIYIVSESNKKFDNAEQMTDNEFMEAAEEEGMVFSIEGFVKEWNFAFPIIPFPDTSYIRILKAESKPSETESGRVETGSLSFKPCGLVTADVIKYVIENVDDFEMEYGHALHHADKWRCGVSNADSGLYDSIIDSVVEYMEDNEIEYDESDLYSDIDIVFN